MKKETAIPPAEQPEAPLKKSRRFRIRYQWIVQNLGFWLFLALLALLYIANGHYAVKNIRTINKTSTEVKELHWRYLDAKSDLMFRSKRSEVSRVVTPLGLKELNAPPQKIIKNEQ
ncbi:FtsL-like putative cell division protein [Compostibacter hankyongensis]|uniref:Cell division protein FtsL n=1 Tax=Compostibacter hankyongensis TaxID=1007089 RepID=A0ABP8FGN8_9BACT